MSGKDGGGLPTGIVYTIVPKPGKDGSRWIRIGAAWLNSDMSLNIKLDALPVNGRLHVRAPNEDEGGDGEEADDEG